MKKYWWIILLGIIVVLILVPLGIAFMVSFRIIDTDTTNEWIGFWGGYLGSIFGGIITLFVMKNTLKQEKVARDREEKIEYFNNIVHIESEAQYAMVKHANCVKEHIRKGLYSIDDKIKVSESNNLSAKINLELQILLETRKETYALSELHKIHMQMHKMIEKSYELYKQCIDEKMENEMLNIATCQLLEELCSKINEVKKELIVVVKNNLY